MTDDEVQEDDTGLFAFDPVQRIDEWRDAMLANPNHYKKFRKEDAIPIAEQSTFRKGEYCKFRETLSRIVQ